MLKNRKTLHRYTYIFALTALTAMLPWSEFLMSSAQFLLLFNWIVEGNFKQKLSILKTRKSILVFISIIIVHFLWLFNSVNIDYGIHDIKIKIPLLILPLIVGTSALINKKELQIIFKVFIISVIFASLFSIAIYLGLTKFNHTGYRELSVFVSHIRFSIMIVIAIILTFWLQKNSTKFTQIALLLIALYLILFLLFLQSLTGIVIFIVISIISAFYGIWIIKNPILKLSIFLLVIGIASYSTFWINNSYTKIRTINKSEIAETRKLTENGNYYKINFTDSTRENGNLVFKNICNKELKGNWEKQSSLYFDSLDNRGNLLKYTLYRYLASKNLTKDSVGFSKLTKKDIENIENGMPNYLYENKFSLYVSLYKFLWEYEMYKNKNNINNKSFIQRIEYFKAGGNIFNSNKLLGVGTGDVQDKFNNYYEKTNSELLPKNRLRAHNQILTFFISFGIIGATIILLAFFYPIFYEHKTEFYSLIILLALFFSFLNEDTLETQPGVTVFTVFYSLLIFGIDKFNKIEP